MLTSPLLEKIKDALQQWEQQPIEQYDARPVSGGDINTSYLLTTKARSYFIKTVTGLHAPAMHQTEAECLRALAQVKLLTVPKVIATGMHETTSFLLLSALDLGASADWPALAHALAHMHQVSYSEFGWQQDNFIGSSVQSNTFAPRWCDFWWEQRLLQQLELAYNNGFGKELRQHQLHLEQANKRLLQAHKPTPVLVHGDLWNGNVGFVRGAKPAVFDPACYYGDREVDLAMSQLFGGFSVSFYSTYHDLMPLPSGHQERAVLYNLYHLFNHLNLFGRSYMPQCLRSIRQLTS